MLYLLLKWLHVLAAVTALGSNLTYAFWINRPGQSPQILAYVLKTIRVLDNRLANRAYGVSLITGLALVFTGKWPLTTPWILVALVLYVAVALFGILRYGPILRKQIDLLETVGPESPEYAAVARQSTVSGMIAVLLVVIIVFLMVVKPALWA